MFLDMVSRRNPELIRAAVRLHQTGEIPPNTYLIDVDAVLANAEKLAATAEEHGLSLYFMTKQFGRHPLLSRWIADRGISRAVAVDAEEARRLFRAGVSLGHVGHLVQPGRSEWDLLLSMRPEVVTVFSLDRARQVSGAACRLGMRQPVLLRVTREGDSVYPGQEGGFTPEDCREQIARLRALKGIRIAGVTAFPVLRVESEKKTVHFTRNMDTLLEARRCLERAGVKVEQLNGPGATSCFTIPLLRRKGVTHGEPGHALTGTTPLHAVREDLPEKPAIIYVTEVSHWDRDCAYVIGGGFYKRSHAAGALVGREPGNILERRFSVVPLSPEFIDYYVPLVGDLPFQTGDTAVFAFRTQIFVTRSHVALVAGLGSGKPQIVHFLRRG